MKATEAPLRAPEAGSPWGLATGRFVIALPQAEPNDCHNAALYADRSCVQLSLTLSFSKVP